MDAWSVLVWGLGSVRFAKVGPSSQAHMTEVKIEVRHFAPSMRASTCPEIHTHKTNDFQHASCMQGG